MTADVSDEIFAHTHEMKRLRRLRPGWAADCYCGETFTRPLAFLAVMAIGRHRAKALKWHPDRGLS